MAVPIPFFQYIGALERPFSLIVLEVFMQVVDILRRVVSTS